MNKFGPDRKELLFRIVLSTSGLAPIGFAIWYRGWPRGPAGFELNVIGGVFCLGSIAWSIWRYLQFPEDD